jgi:biopolymer transport protein ExbD/biopolymer transport protein TolR
MSIGANVGEFNDINVTPLTDVFLVLLVIMILIAPLIDKSELKIKPPETQHAKKPDESKGIFVDIDKDGQIAVNGRAIGVTDAAGIQAKIEEFLRRSGKRDVTCTVNADADCKEKEVVAVMTAAAAAGIKRMRVATIQSGNY